MWNWVERLTELRLKTQPFVLVTVTGCTGSTPREVGAKMIVSGSGRDSGTVGGGHLEELAIQDALRCLSEKQSKSIRYPLGAKTGQCCGGVVDLFMEVLNTGPKLYLFGAGHVGQAVCRSLTGTAFQVHVIDPREEWIGSEQIPKDAIRHSCHWDEMLDEIEWHDQTTYVAIMTHRHDIDQDIVAHVIQKPSRYIGLIGSQSKWLRFQQRLEARGVSNEQLERVKCPIGIDIGGKAPQEVAISLASEILRIHYQK